MAGTLELFHDRATSFGFRVKAPGGTVVGVSRPFSDKASAAEGIGALRECAGTGLIIDLCPANPNEEAKGTTPIIGIEERGEVGVPAD